MATDDSGSMNQSNADSSAGFQTQANAGSQVNQAAQDINQINQTAQGSENQTIGQVYGGVVVYVSGGQAVFNQPQSEASQSGESEAAQEIGPNPYKGLLAFHEKDQDLYFGRSREIEALRTQCLELLEQPDGVRLLPIYGPSGSGKSSLARAGLIPELGKRPLPGRDRARVAVMVPGTQPLQALATVLARIATNDLTPVLKIREFEQVLSLPNKAGEYDGLQRIASALPEIATFPLVVLVDQFEEVYSLCEDTEARDSLVSNLLYAAKERSRYVSVLMTMRSDFLGGAQKHPQLDRLLSNQGFYVPSMDEEALREVIALPAEKAGHPLDDATIQLLIEQTEGREGALPLLQFALTRIWEGLAEGNTPAKTLEQIGGVGGALAGEAQRVYNGLSEEEKEIARRLFLGLVQLGEGTRDTRRRAAVDSLMARADQPKQFRQVMERFTAPGVRLMTVSAEGSEETAEVTHEALFEHWDELNVWLDDSRDDLRFQRRLEEAAVYWEEQGKPGGSLWRNPDLGLLRSYHQRLSEQMTVSQLAFFEAATEQETQQRKRETRQKQMLWLGLGLLTVFAGGMAWFGFQSRQATQRALARQWAAQSLQVSNPLTGALLALEPLQHWRKELGEVNNGLRENLAKLPAVTLMGDEGEIDVVNFSPDGKRLATASRDGKSGLLWDVESGERLATFNHEDRVLAVSFSSDGKHLATASQDGTVGLWDVESGKRLDTFKYEGSVWAVSFNRDGALLAMSSNVETVGGRGKMVVELWDVESGQLLATGNHDLGITAVSFSPDGMHLAISSVVGTAEVWEVETGKRIATLNHEGGVDAVSFSPDGKHLATASRDRKARLWDLESGQRLFTLYHDGPVWGVSFNGNGTRLATTSGDGTARLWHVESGQRIATLTHESAVSSVRFSPDGTRLATTSGVTALVWELERRERVATLTHEDRVLAMSFSPDGKYVATASSDETAGVWEVESGERVATLTHEDRVLAVSFSSDGKRVATASDDGTAELWAVESGERLATLTHDDALNMVRFSPDGKRVATASWDGTAGVWELASGKRLTTLNHESGVSSVRFSPDGKRVATASRDGTAGVWEVESGKRVATLTHEDRVLAVSFSSDGKRVATASDDGITGLWAVESGERLATLTHDDALNMVRFSPDGKRVATASADGTAGVWDVKSGERIATLNHEDRVLAVSFSSDGKRVATASHDGTAGVWEVESGERVATINHEDEVEAVSFSSDGKRVATASGYGTTGVHWVWSSDLETASCNRLNRNLTALEWKKYHQTDLRQYRLTCDGLPVHPSLLTEARKLAEAGEVREATALYRRLLKVSRKVEPPLDLDPWTKHTVEQDHKAVAKAFASGIGIIRDAEQFARNGRIYEAIEQYQKALKLNPDIDLNPATDEREQDPEAVANAIAEAAEKQ